MNTEQRLQDLENRSILSQRDTGEVAARIGRAVDSGSSVFPVVLTSFTNGAFKARRLAYKDSPPIEGEFEFDGDEIDVYPPPGFMDTQLKIPGLVFSGVINDVTKFHVIPLLAVTNSRGDAEVYIPLKPPPSATFLPYAANQVISDGSGA